MKIIYYQSKAIYDSSKRREKFFDEKYIIYLLTGIFRIGPITFYRKVYMRVYLQNFFVLLFLTRHILCRKKLRKETCKNESFRSLYYFVLVDKN